MAFVFEKADTPIVSFSGGKDSTVLLDLAAMEAAKRNKRLHVAFFDEEIVDPDVEAAMARPVPARPN